MSTLPEDVHNEDEPEVVAPVITPLDQHREGQVHTDPPKPKPHQVPTLKQLIAGDVVHLPEPEEKQETPPAES